MSRLQPSEQRKYFIEYISLGSEFFERFDNIHQPITLLPAQLSQVTSLISPKIFEFEQI